MEKIWTAQMTEADLPCTVGQALRRLAGLTEAQIRSAKFRKNGITVNGVQARVTAPLAPNSVLQVILESEEEKADPDKVAPVDMPLTVLYEDEDILAVHKDAGVPVHPSHGHYDDTLANAAAWYLSHVHGSKLPIRAVGRLDAETSGIVLFAKNKVACERLSREGAVEKTYTAIACGETQAHMDLRMPVRKMPGELNRMEISVTEPSSAEGWLSAITHVTRSKVGVYNRSKWSLVRVKIETGRTHQIRVHMAGAGHPLLGDRIYGSWEQEAYTAASEGMTRAALHCGHIELTQPFTGAHIEVDDPLPADMAAYVT